MRNKGFSVLFVIMVIVIVFISITRIKDSIGTKINYIETNYSAEEVLKLLENNNHILIHQNILSLNRQYFVIINNEKVATVEGKYLKTFGDVFSLISSGGELIVYEEEEILNLNRQAQIYNSDNEKTGRFESKYLSLGYTFNIYDREGILIGYTKNNLPSFLKQITVFNNDDVEIYSIKKTDIYINKYEITYNEESTSLNKTDIVLLACIEDVLSESDD